MNLIRVPVFQAQKIGDETSICHPIRIVNDFIINADKIISICYGKHNGMDLCTVRISRDISFYVNLSIVELAKKIEDFSNLSSILKQEAKEKALSGEV